MKKYGFVLTLIFGCFCGPLWGGGDLSVFGVPMGVSPDEQLRQGVREQIAQIIGGGNQDVDDDRAADDLLIHVRLFRLTVQNRMGDLLDGDGLVRVRFLRNLAQELLGGNGHLSEIVTFVCDLLLAENSGGFSYEDFDCAFNERVREVYAELAG